MELRILKSSSLQLQYKLYSPMLAIFIIKIFWFLPSESSYFSGGSGVRWRMGALGVGRPEDPQHDCK